MTEKVATAVETTKPEERAKIVAAYGLCVAEDEAELAALFQAIKDRVKAMEADGNFAGGVPPRIGKAFAFAAAGHDALVEKSLAPAA